MGLLTPCTVPRGGFLYRMIVPVGGFCPGGVCLGGIVMDKIDTCIIQPCLKKPQTNRTSRIVVIMFTKVLNFGSNILAGKFPVSGHFLRHCCIHVHFMCPYFLASVPLASIPSTASILLFFSINFLSLTRSICNVLALLC